MFSKLAVVSSLAFLAVATPTPGGGGGSPPPPVPASQCNTGDLQCCNSLQSASSGAAGLVLGLLGIVLQDLSVFVGLTCSPLNILGIGGNSCTAQPVCCQNNSFNGLIAIGCTPVNVNL